jgi:hypothetical protein
MVTMSHSKTITTNATAGKTGADARSRVILWAGLAALVSAVLGQWWLSPVLCTFPLVWIVHRESARVDAASLAPFVVRWALTVFAVTLVCSAFIPHRVPGSVLLGRGVEITVLDWFAGEGGPVWGLPWLVIAPVVIAVLTALSGGVLGVAFLSIALGDAAVSAAMIYARGENLFTTSLIALSPWQWAFLGGALLSVPAIAGLSLPRVLRREATPADPAKVRRQLVWAAGLFALAIVLRAVFAPAYASLVARWTIL